MSELFQNIIKMVSFNQQNDDDIKIDKIEYQFFDGQTFIEKCSLMNFGLMIKYAFDFILSLSIVEMIFFFLIMIIVLSMIYFILKKILVILFSVVFCVSKFYIEKIILPFVFFFICVISTLIVLFLIYNYTELFNYKELIPISNFIKNASDSIKIIIKTNEII